MMHKKFISYILISCFSAFVVHNLVPHHHHAEAYHHPIATDCPFNHGDHDGDENNHETESTPGEHPAHCHAFNDVVFEKYNAPLTRIWSGQLSMLEISFQKQIGRIQEESSNLLIFYKLACCTPPDFGTRALRAPPART